MRDGLGAPRLCLSAARESGVLERPGHTEASADLAALAGFAASAVICEVLDDDGHMAGPEVLRQFAEVYGLPTLTVRDLIVYLKRFPQKNVRG